VYGDGVRYIIERCRVFSVEQALKDMGYHPSHSREHQWIKGSYHLILEESVRGKNGRKRSVIIILHKEPYSPEGEDLETEIEMISIKTKAFQRFRRCIGKIRSYIRGGEKRIALSNVLKEVQDLLRSGILSESKLQEILAENERDIEEKFRNAPSYFDRKDRLETLKKRLGLETKSL